MVWNSEGTTERVILSYAGSEHDVTGLTGMGLVEKIKNVAKDNGISKFDVVDATGKNLTVEEIEAGTFSAPLKIMKFNAAA